MIVGSYVTPQYVAKEMKCDDEQVLCWIHSGELAAVNVAKDPNGKRPRWRISESDFAKFLLARRHPASAQVQTIRRQPRTQPKKYV